MPFPYNNIRDFVEDLEREGELIRCKKEVDWNLEVGAIFRRLAEVGKGRTVKKGGQPAVLFEKIKGYPEGYRMLCHETGSYKRLAMAHGLPDPESATQSRVVDVLLDAMDHPIKPIVVKEAACKKNKMMGEEVNLYKLPAPMLHDGDGGRYLCTDAVNCCKDPDSDWTNWGMYRAMILDRRTLAGLIISIQHGGLIHEKYERRDEPMPVAIAIGADPLSLYSATCSIPYSISEMDVVGGLRKQPLEVIKCETSDLLVPAGAEIVIEAEVPPRIRAWEGPFGEYTGFRASPRDLRFVYRVKAITWRDDPILTFATPGMPVDISCICTSAGVAAEQKRELKQKGIPFTDLSCPPEACGNLTVVSVPKPTPRRGLAEQIMHHILATKMGLNNSFRVLVVNDDVNIHDFAEILHAIVHRVHPDRVTTYRGPSQPLIPYGSMEERLKEIAPKMLLDGTWPVDWHPWIAVPPVSSFKHLYPQEIQDKVESEWTSYGFPKI